MRWTRLGSVVLAAALAAPLAIAGGTFFEAWSKLLPPDSSPQAKAIGVCYVRETSEYDKFSLVVEGVSEDGQLDIYLGNGEEGVEKIGELKGGTSRREFVKSTYDEDGLPLGVESVRSLGGRRVEVRDGEERVVVEGEVPNLPSADGGDKPDGGDGDGGDKPDGGDGGDGTDKPDGGDGGGGDTDKPTDLFVAKSVFHRTEFAGKLDARGVVVVTKRTDGGEIRFEVAGLALETGYLLSIGARGNMSLVDDFRTDAKGGASIVRDTAKDPGLPLEAESVDDLAGKRVEVRDLDENVVLYTEVPSVETEKDVTPVKEKETTADEETGSKVVVKVDILPKKGREEMTIVVKDVPKTTKSAGKRFARRFAELRIDDGSGTFQPAARARVQGRRARIHITTRGARELPLGVESLRDISGRPFEVLVDGTRVVGGTLPQF